MMYLLITLAIVLIIGISLAIFRVFTLVSIAKNPGDKKITSSNTINAALLLLLPIVGFILAGWYTVKAKSDYLLPLASEHGATTDYLLWITIIVISIVFVITNLFLFYFSYKYRYQKDRKALFYPTNDRLEIIWTIVPAIVLTVLVLSGWKAWTGIMKPAPEEAQIIEIMGKQFAWQVRYPGEDGKLGKYNYLFIDNKNEMGIDFTDKNAMDDFLPREIHIVKGKPVLFKIRARDVLHSVFAPHFRLKMDAVPGQPTQFWFTPTVTTQEMRDSLSRVPEWQEINPKTEQPKYATFNYEIACTEVCGRGHFSMRYLLVVDTEESYKKWLEEQEPWAAKNKDYVDEAVVRQKRIIGSGNKLANL